MSVTSFLYEYSPLVLKLNGSTLGGRYSILAGETPEIEWLNIRGKADIAYWQVKLQMLGALFYQEFKGTHVVYFKWAL